MLLRCCTLTPGEGIRVPSPTRSPLAPLRAKIPGQRQCWAQPRVFPQPSPANSSRGTGIKG